MYSQAAQPPGPVQATCRAWRTSDSTVPSSQWGKSPLGSTRVWGQPGPSCCPDPWPLRPPWSDRAQGLRPLPQLPTPPHGPGTSHHPAQHGHHGSTSLSPQPAVPSPATLTLTATDRGQPCRDHSQSSAHAASCVDTDITAHPPGSIPLPVYPTFTVLLPRSVCGDPWVCRGSPWPTQLDTGVQGWGLRGALR